MELENRGLAENVGEHPVYPALLTHPYANHALNEAIVLYRGTYCLPPSDPDERAYDGVVKLTWLPEPEIEAHGERTAGISDYVGAGFATEAEQSGGTWTTIPTVRLPGGSGVPPMPAQPDKSADPAAPGSRVSAQLTTMIYPPEFGDGSALNRVTGLVVNGFDAWDGHVVADPAGGRFPTRARTIGRGGGWVATLDTVPQGPGTWEQLEASRGYRVTQVVELARVDGADFSAQQAMHALEVIGYALTIALGRHACVMLPIGFRSEEPAWTRWGFRRVDPFRSPGTWLDRSVTSSQVGELIGRTLEVWDDELHRDTLRDAASYLVQSQSGEAELGITLPVSGLTLLSYSHLVEGLEVRGKRQWNHLSVGEQIREVIASLHGTANLAVPANLAHLEALRVRMSANSPEPVIDGLACIIKMRNAIMHPTRGERSDWTYEEVVEGCLFAIHVFEIALLAYVGYRGKVHPRTASVRMAGYLEDMP